MFLTRHLRTGGSLFIAIAGMLLTVYLILFMALVLFGQQHLEQTTRQRAMAALEKRAATVGYFIAEQKDAMSNLANDRSLQTFLSNKALGMSMEYGLRSSLLQIVNHFQALLARKLVHGKPIYRRLTFFDAEGRALANDSAMMPKEVAWNGPIPSSDAEASLLLTTKAECANTCWLAPVVYHGRMAGFIVAEMDFHGALDKLLRSDLGEQDRYLRVRDNHARTIYPAHATPLKIDHDKRLQAMVTDSELLLEDNIELTLVEAYLLSPWLPLAIAVLTLPLLFGLAFLLRLNNQNLVLKTQNEASREKGEILRRQKDMQSIISHIAAGLLQAPAVRMDEAIDQALRESGEHLAADRAYLFLLSEDGKSSSNTHEWCSPGVAPQIEFLQDTPVTLTPWWWEQMSKGRLLLAPDVMNLPAEAESEKTLFSGQSIQSLFAFPLVKDDKTFGFIGYDAVKERRQWIAEEIELLQIMADVIVNALARWQTEMELTESERKMREAQAFAHLGRWSLDAKTLQAEWSEEIYHIMGISQQEHSPGFETLKKVLYAPDQSCVFDSLQHCLEQEAEHKLDYRIVRPDGEQRWVNCRARPVTDAAGDVIRLEGFFQDITERKQTEQKHHESEMLFSKAFHAAGAIMTISDLETGALENVNDTFVQTTGFTCEEALGNSATGLALIDERKRDRLKQRLLNDGNLRNLELKFNTKDNLTLHCIYNGEIIEIEGKKKLLSIVQDITPLMESQLALKTSEERFALAMRASNDGVYDWNLLTGEIYFSPRCKAMLGYADDELDNHLSSWERLFCSEDRERSQAMLQDYIDGKRDDYSLEIRLRHKNHYLVDVLTRAYLVRDENGRPVRLVGTHLDITERKQNQRQIEEERNRAQRYLDVAGVMLIALDRHGRVSLINPKGCELLGLPETAIIGQDWFTRFLPEKDAETIRSVFTQIISGRLDTLEYMENPIVDAQGNERLIAWHNSVIRDEQGHIATILSSGEDVTERRRAERALNAERAFLQDVIDGIDDPILVVGRDYNILRMNHTAQQAAKKNGLDASCVTCHQASHHSEKPCNSEQHVCPLRTVLQTGSPCKVLHEHTAPNGEQRTFEIAASPLLDSEGQISGIIEASRDITEHLALLDELKEREVRYAHLAQHDPLTGLPNRLLFADRLSHAIHSSHRSGVAFAVLYIDLDLFKHVNDSFDHSYGDEVLKAVAARLQALFREEDTIARMGGDEFTVILSSIRQDEDAARVAVKILELLKEPFEILGHSIFLGASVGISLYPQHGANVDDLVRNADTAMYRAKEEGRNTFRYYSEELTAKAFERVRLESKLHQAVERDEFVLHYQPQFSLIDGQICGFEALVRWQHPEMGLVPPLRFIPLAEESGIIVSMGEWILREACRQMKAWQDAGKVSASMLMSVNLSAKQFDQSDLIARIDGILRDTTLAPATLELEVTESTMMRSPDLSSRVLRQLRELDVKVAIDDFGTGYSSLNHLKLLPLTKLKIDQSFVSDIPQDANDMAITRAVIALAHSLSLEVLAEGVETQEQRLFLTNEGCHSAQGYLFSRPLPAQDVETFLQDIRDKQVVQDPSLA